MQQQIAYYEAKLAFEMDPADLFYALENTPNYVVIDTRQTHGFIKEHIPTAINFPHREMNKESTQHLDKNKTYICYCDGIGCNGSTRGALKMAKLGFKVKELIGGIEWWKKDGFATEGEKSTQGSLLKCAC